MQLPISIASALASSTTPLTGPVVYFLRLHSGQLYIESSTDLRQRLLDHANGKACYTTRLDPPVALLRVESVSSFADARRREAQLKGWSQAKKEALIRGPIARLAKLSRSREHAAVDRKMESRPGAGLVVTTAAEPARCVATRARCENTGVRLNTPPVFPDYRGVRSDNTKVRDDNRLVRRENTGVRCDNLIVRRVSSTARFDNTPVRRDNTVVSSSNTVVRSANTMVGSANTAAGCVARVVRGDRSSVRRDNTAARCANTMVRLVNTPARRDFLSESQ